MPENHVLFSSPLPRTNGLYPAACTSLSNAINVPPNGYVWSNCGCYLGTHVWKKFYSLIRDCGCSDPPPTSPQLQTSISLLQYLAVWSDFKMHSDVAPWAARERWEILTSAPQEPALPWNVLRMRPRSQISAIIVIPALSQFWKTSVFLKMIQISATHPPQRLLEQTWRSAPGMRNVFLQQWRAEQRQLVFCYTLMHRWW